MREIKFREWDPMREKMLGKGMSYSKREEFDDSVNFRFDHEEDLDFSNRLEETDEAGTPLRKLMQYTGLKDKNGTEIYEGDIIEVSDHPFQNNGDGVGIYIEGNYEVKWEDYDLTWLAGNLLLARIKPYIKVIGNIYENSELLEVEK